MIVLKKFFLFSSCIAVLSGCAAQAEFISNYSPVPGLTMHSFSDNLQNTFFKEGQIDTRFCLQPSPDVALSLNGGLTFDSVVNDGIGLTESSSAVNLGGRGDLTLMTRELLYRACELSMNGNLNPQDSREVYKDFLDAVVEITENVYINEDYDEDDDE